MPTISQERRERRERLGLPPLPEAPLPTRFQGQARLADREETRRRIEEQDRQRKEPKDAGPTAEERAADLPSLSAIARRAQLGEDVAQDLQSVRDARDTPGSVIDASRALTPGAVTVGFQRLLGIDGQASREFDEALSNPRGEGQGSSSRRLIDAFIRAWDAQDLPSFEGRRLTEDSPTIQDVIRAAQTGQEVPEYQRELTGGSLGVKGAGEILLQPDVLIPAGIGATRLARSGVRGLQNAAGRRAVTGLNQRIAATSDDAARTSLVRQRNQRVMGNLRRGDVRVAPAGAEDEVGHLIARLENDIADVTAQIDDVARVVRPPRSQVRVTRTGRTVKAVDQRYKDLDRLTNQELIRLAEHEGRNPFAPDWFDSLDSDLVRTAIRDRSFRNTDDLTLPQLKRRRITLQNELDDELRKLGGGPNGSEAIDDLVRRKAQEEGVGPSTFDETFGEGPGLPARSAGEPPRTPPSGPPRLGKGGGPRPPRSSSQTSLPPAGDGDLLPNPRSIADIEATTFQDNAARRLGERIAGPDAPPTPLRMAVRTAAPNIQAPRTTLERLDYIKLVQRDESKRLVDVAMAHPQSIGTSEGLFGVTDPRTGLFRSGRFKGRALGEIAENPSRFQLDDAQAEFVKRLRDVDMETRELGLRNGIEVGLADTSSTEFFAGRVMVAKQTDDGLIHLGAAGSKGRRLGSQTGSEQVRQFSRLEDAIKEGYVPINYETAVRLRAQAMYNRVNDKRLAEAIVSRLDELGVKTKARTKGRVATDVSVDVPGLEGVFLTGPNAQKVRQIVERLEKTTEVHQALKLVADVNSIQRVFALAVDNSGGGIQLLPTFMRHPLVGLKSEKAFISQLIRGFKNPEAAKRWHAQLVNQSRDLFQDMPGLITTRAGTEITEALDNAGVLERLFTSQRKIAWPLRQINRYAIDPFRIAYETQMDAAGILLGRGLRHVAKNADELADVADYINKMRGLSLSARSGVGARQRIIEAVLLLAPRYRRAVASLYVDIFQGGLRGKLAREALAALIAGTTLTYTALSMALGAIQGKTWDQIVSDTAAGLNPADSRFLLFNAGESVWGLGSKFVQDVRLFTRVFTNAPQDNNGVLYGIFDPDGDHEFIDNPVVRSIRSQMAGFPSKVVDVLYRENVVGEPFDLTDPVSFMENVGDFAVPIWLQAALFDEGGFKDRAIRGGVDFFGGRSFPEGTFDVLKEESRSILKKEYDDAEQFERQLLRDMIQDQLGPLEQRQIELGSETTEIFAELAEIEDERIGKLLAMAQSGRFDYLAYIKIEAEARGARRQASLGLEFEGRDPLNPLDQALEDYNEVFNDETSYDDVGNFTREAQRRLRQVESSWTESQQEYVLRNSNRRPVPRALLRHLPRIRRTSIARSQEARERYLRETGRDDLIPYVRALFYVEPVGTEGAEGVLFQPTPTPEPVSDEERRARRERLGLEALPTP